MLLIACSLLLNTTVATAATCSAESGKFRVPLLELYTSEGCSSCPPTDRWVSALPQRGHTPQRVLTLSFHVDYWNYLGWKDPYAKAAYGERQRSASHRNLARFVYTPQLLLDGRDYRRGIFRDDFGERIAAINHQAPDALIRMTMDANGDQQILHGTVSISGSVTRRTAQTYVAIYENNLVNNVTAGENRDKQLHHDFVVRELFGPFAADAAGKTVIKQNLRQDRSWKAADLNVAVFVQDSVTGKSLQTLNLRWCTTDQ